MLPPSFEGLSPGWSLKSFGNARRWRVPRGLVVAVWRARWICIGCWVSRSRRNPCNVDLHGAGARGVKGNVPCHRPSVHTRTAVSTISSCRDCFRRFFVVVSWSSECTGTREEEGLRGMGLRIGAGGAEEMRKRTEAAPLSNGWIAVSIFYSRRHCLRYRGECGEEPGCERRVLQIGVGGAQKTGRTYHGPTRSRLFQSSSQPSPPPLSLVMDVEC